MELSKAQNNDSDTVKGSILSANREAGESETLVVVEEHSQTCGPRATHHGGVHRRGESFDVQRRSFNDSEYATINTPAAQPNTSLPFEGLSRQLSALVDAIGDRSSCSESSRSVAKAVLSGITVALGLYVTLILTSPVERHTVVNNFIPVAEANSTSYLY